MKLILITGDQVRHKFFADFLATQFDLELVVSEKKAYNFWDNTKHFGQSMIIKDHFRSLEITERKFFSEAEWPQCKVLTIERGELRGDKIKAVLRQAKADIGIVFGSGILTPDIIAECPTLLNVHQGISPYFRGSGTNFWPFVFGKLEYVGVTLHQIDCGVDTGGIICHGFPEISSKHSMHDIGCECIKTSARLVTKVLNGTDASGKFYPIQQWSTGRVFKRADLTDQAIETANRLVREGLIENFVANGGKEVFQTIKLSV